MAKRELLFSLTKKDFVVETFPAGKAGGQRGNKKDTAVRIKHPDSGAVGESREERHQHQNKKIAFDRLVTSPRFRVWHAMRCREIMEGETIEQKVQKMMSPENIKVEVIDDDGEWVETN